TSMNWSVWWIAYHSSNVVGILWPHQRQYLPVQAEDWQLGHVSTFDYSIAEFDEPSPLREIHQISFQSDCQSRRQIFQGIKDLIRLTTSFLLDSNRGRQIH